MSNNNTAPVHKTKIGGQALIEGIMMKGVSKTAMAVRMPDGTIDVEEWASKAPKWYNKAPFIRGVFNFIGSLVEGSACMTKSAEKSMAEDEEEASAFEKWLEKVLGDKGTSVIMTIVTVLAFILAFGLFMFLPTNIYTGIEWLTGGENSTTLFFRPLFESVLKIAIFVGYIALMSRLKDIRRTFEYHGAEHKTITAYENHLELTVENIKKQTRFHPRCGTSFIFIIFMVSILVYTFVPINKQMFVDMGLTSFMADLSWILLKLLILPVIVGISYELIRLAGKYDNIFTRIISMPGLWMQRLTTKEPDDQQIEVAIASVLPVLPKDGEDDSWGK